MIGVAGPVDLDMGSVAAVRVGMGRWVEPQRQARSLSHLVLVHGYPRMNRNADITHCPVECLF